MVTMYLHLSQWQDTLNLYLVIKSNFIYSCMAKLQHLSVLYEPSEIIVICWFGAQETILLSKLLI